MDPYGQPSADPAGRPPALPDAVRIQVAAVAAQQIANDHEEIRLAERRTAVEQEAHQVAAHLEDKRRQLLLLNERLQTERAALQHERQAHERQLERISADESQPQRELLKAQKQVQAERDRLARLRHKLKQRWRRHWQRKQQDFLQRQQAQARLAASLAQRELRVGEMERTLHEQRLRFNGDVELARVHVKETWGNLRQTQFRWRHRRGLERAALRVRARELEIAAQSISRARTQLAHDQRAWQTQRQALEVELEGLNTRVQNQRHVLDHQEAHLRALDIQIFEKRQQLAGLASSSPVDNQPVDNQPATAMADGATTALLDAAKAGRAAEGNTGGVGDGQRVVDLEQMAQALADQRCQLAEAWERVAALHDRWHADRAEAAAELEAQATRLLERDFLVQAREQASAQADEVLRQRHQELLQLQEQMIAWRARLHIEENAWDSDKVRMLAELRSKDAAAEQHLAMLVELRQRWAKRRKQEVDELQSERSTLETFRKEFAKLRVELLKRATALEEEKRVIVEKTLALEQYREQTLSRADDDPQADRRLERLRRRWVTQNAEALRNLSRERAALYAELKAIEHRHEELQGRAAEIAAAEMELTEKQTAWDEQQVLLEAQHARLESDLHNAQEQRLFAEQQLVAMREEVERIARALLDEPNPPLLSMDQAA